MMKIKGQELDINYYEELEPYLDKFERMQIRGEELTACSPLRDERRPSFSINLGTGLWIDRGGEGINSRGNIVSLLAHLRQETYEETADYLLEVYGHILDNADELTLDLQLELEPAEVTLLAQEKYENRINKPSEYLKSRKIDIETQKLFNTGISEKGDAICLPWHDWRGRIINMKYRKINSKEFWYSSGGQPVKKHLYGLFLVLELHKKQRRYNKTLSPVYLVESEIDALCLWSIGKPAIAFGGSSISEQQQGLIVDKLSDCELILATDNDKVGQKFRKVLAKELGGYFIIKELEIPEGYKDVNELEPELINNLKQNFINFFN
jgi:5S rRNA maturation endonuclease (ribonuclease M5)